MSTNHVIATAAQLGTAFAKHELRVASDLASFAESAIATGAAASLVTYSAWSAEFQTAAVAAGYVAADRLFQRTWAAAVALGFLGEKPKAETPAAKAKAEKRAEAAAAIAGKTPAELVAASIAASAAGNVSEAAGLMVAAQSAKKVADKAAKDAAAEQVKALRLSITDALARLIKSNDVKSIQKLAAAALKLSPVPKEEPAKL